MKTTPLRTTGILSAQSGHLVGGDGSDAGGLALAGRPFLPWLG